MAASTPAHVLECISLYEAGCEPGVEINLLPD